MVEPAPAWGGGSRKDGSRFNSRVGDARGGQDASEHVPKPGRKAQPASGGGGLWGSVQVTAGTVRGQMGGNEWASFTYPVAGETLGMLLGLWLRTGGPRAISEREKRSCLQEP